MFVWTVVNTQRLGGASGAPLVGLEESGEYLI
jgi:hypothetical protein